MTGTLVDFDVEQRLVKIQREGDDKVLALKFNQIKRLKFNPPVVSDGQTDAEMGYADSDFGALHAFVVQLKDGALFSGISHAYRKLSYGLWLYPKKTLESDPLRVFIPNSAYSHYEIKGDFDTVIAASDDAPTDFGDTVFSMVDEADLQSVAKGTVSLVETPEQLVAAIDQQSSLKPVPIGEALLGLGKITPAQLSAALQSQQNGQSAPLGQMLVDKGLITPEDLQTAIARKMGYPFVDVRKYPVDAAVLRMVPFGLATRLKVLPLGMHRSAIVLAMADPLQFKVINELEFTTQKKIIPVVTTADDLVVRITRTYREIGFQDTGSRRADSDSNAPTAASLNVGDAFQLASELVVNPADHEDEKQVEQSDNTLVKLINSMIIEAYQQGASDIHIEPYPGRQKMVIRFRVDGELRPYLELPPTYRSALIARIKIMCDLDISEKRKAQDGKINFAKFGGLRIELRVATIPTADGIEDVVMRILSSSKSIPVDSLGLSAHNKAAFMDAVQRPYGMFLCVGPTGSGKTTTLHAALQHINQPNRKIWTAEDPVEITQHGLRQIQVNPKIGWSFAAALRSLLRADPDVIMVGEIRDKETAEIAVEASLTGHLVLSTLHTNSAPETLTRLTDLGLDPFAFADSLLAVLAQRLVRRLCGACVQAAPMNDEQLAELLQDYQIPLADEHPDRDAQRLKARWVKEFGAKGGLLHRHAPGCEKCGGTGYKGRVGIHEMLVTSPGIRHLVQTKARSEEVQALAIAQGMRTLRQDGIEKVLMGLTTLTEIRATSNF